MPPFQLYELVGKTPSLKISPYCWRIRFALKHKGLDFESVPLTFLEVHEQIPKLGQDLIPRVPVLVDPDNVAHQDSFSIAEYLETAYPDKPSLFHGQPTLHRFFQSYVDKVISMAIFRVIVRQIPERALDQPNREYFYRSRTEMLRVPLEEIEAQRTEWAQQVQKGMELVRQAIQDSGKFLSGDQVGYADFILFGTFKWVENINKDELEELLLKGQTEDDTVVRDWFQRMQVYA
ncbi:uncharacterized protein VTP21DRAFT_7253 [Calcarisporiella thermophila]|uniref:uncharacterized protein n=1 Tax=Calcarisporiella thermophila TaxID=911321 RepID=UPI0037434D58